MAGSWPDMPSRKMAYHDDGTVVAGRFEDSGAPYENFYEWSAPNVEELNDLDMTPINTDWPNAFPATTRLFNGVLTSVETLWIFPERRDVLGFVGYFNHSGGSTDAAAVEILVSTDTTNGVDGTWTRLVYYRGGDSNPANNMLYDLDPEAWRTGIVTCNFTGVRGVRSYSYQTLTSQEFAWRAAYIFGTISSGETPDRILFVDDNTGLEFTKPMDWGDVPRGTTLDWDIYLLNNSSTLSANAPQTLDFVTLYNSSDTWFTISDSGGAFGTTANVPTMAAGARYPAADVFTVRLDVPDDEPFSIYEAILELSPASSWT